MRRHLILMQLALPALLLGGCFGPATSRQVADFAVSTGVRVFVQTISSIIEASILQGA